MGILGNLFCHQQKSDKPCVIVGLGNPGEEYKGTLHNIGFEVLNLFAKKYQKKFKKKYQSQIFAIIYRSHKLFFQKPMTYMNFSGDAVAQLCKECRLSRSQVIVIYDDVNLPLGQMRIRMNGSAGGHNGIKDMIAKLGGDDFIRLRLGVGKLPIGKKLEDYVLEPFTEVDKPLAKEVCQQAVKAVLMLCDNDCKAVMNLFNGKSIKLIEQPSQETIK